MTPSAWPSTTRWASRHFSSRPAHSESREKLGLLVLFSLHSVRPGRRKSFVVLVQTVIANLHRTVYNTISWAINGATDMNTISANELKTKGVNAIEQALANQQEATVTVRGQMKYVVMSTEQYAHLRDCELEAALAESKADLDAGRFVKESVEQHLKRLAKLAK